MVFAGKADHAMWIVILWIGYSHVMQPRPHNPHTLFTLSIFSSPVGQLLAHFLILSSALVVRFASSTAHHSNHAHGILYNHYQLLSYSWRSHFLYVGYQQTSCVGAQQFRFLALELFHHFSFEDDLVARFYPSAAKGLLRTCICSRNRRHNPSLHW